MGRLPGRHPAGGIGHHGRAGCRKKVGGDPLWQLRYDKSRRLSVFRRLSENEIFFSRSRKAEIITTEIQYFQAIMDSCLRRNDAIFDFL